RKTRVRLCYDRVVHACTRPGKPLNPVHCTRVRTWLCTRARGRALGVHGGLTRLRPRAVPQAAPDRRAGAVAKDSTRAPGPANLATPCTARVVARGTARHDADRQ